MLTPEQLALRKHTIGSSEVGAAIGLNPWQTPHELWAIKRGLMVSEENHATRWGQKIESLLAEMYSEDTGAELAHFGTVVHPEHSWVSATPDRAVFGTRRLCELKCVGWRSALHWGPGPEDVPDYYRAQIEWQCFVAGADECDVAALIGGTDFRIYRIKRSEILLRSIFNAAREFWGLVESGTPPSADGSEGARRMLSTVFPRSDRKLLKPATAEAEVLAASLAAAREAKASAEAEEARLENLFREHIADAEGVAGRGWRATWKSTKTGTRQFLFKKKGEAA